MRLFYLVTIVAAGDCFWSTAEAWAPSPQKTNRRTTRVIRPLAFPTATATYDLRRVSSHSAKKWDHHHEEEDRLLVEDSFFPFSSVVSTKDNDNEAPNILLETKPNSKQQQKKSILYDHEQRALLIAVVTLLSTPAIASAAGSPTSSPLPSALAAYVHYLSLLLMTASIMTERLTVQADMSLEDEKLLGTADILTGVAGTLLLASGYYRATDVIYGKGWDYYSHEPIFWFKLTLLGIFGGLSLFPTITIIQRTVKIQQEGTIEPMSEALASRMKKIMNAELTALATIPFTATLMARNIGYVQPKLKDLSFLLW